MLRFTDRAVQALARTDGAARRFDPGARLRLVPDPAQGVRAELVAEAEAEADGLLTQLDDGPGVYVDPSLRGTVDVGEHDVLTLDG